MAEAAPEPRDWATEITQWLQATGKTQTWYKQVLADALRLEEGERAAPSPGQVGKALRGLGWVKDKYQSGQGKDRAVVWRAPKQGCTTGTTEAPMTCSNIK